MDRPFSFDQHRDRHQLASGSLLCKGLVDNDFPACRWNAEEEPSRLGRPTKQRQSLAL